ncbi:SH2 domain-containing protein 4A [Acipenser ruthenus]|uniref:SH2 domain-containing protein 4A n=1 Tax=Acipenser ruthenus TaxID=7906 RepID=A0A444UE98_ACIRT|nr:SH2 domain-containing protein 4A [Acipenser ruthenus]
MLQQILKEMYIDPDVLEALNEEQKKILFLKMRQEQFLNRSFLIIHTSRLQVRTQSASPKSVSWLLGNDGDVHVCVIGEAAGAKPYDLIHSQVDDKRETNNHNASLQSCKVTEFSFLPTSPKSVSWLLGNDGDVHVCVIGEAAGAKPYDLIHSQVDDKRETNNHNARAPVSETFQKTLSTPQEDGIQLNFQTAEKEEDTADPMTELKDSGLYYRPHLQHKEPQSLALRLSARDRQEEKAGRDFKIVPAARRPMLSSDSEEANQSPDNPTAQGRVAELRKNFNHLQVTSGKNTLSRVKPPLPANVFSWIQLAAILLYDEAVNPIKPPPDAAQDDRIKCFRMSGTDGYSAYTTDTRM